MTHIKAGEQQWRDAREADNFRDTLRAWADSADTLGDTDVAPLDEKREQHKREVQQTGAIADMLMLAIALVLLCVLVANLIAHGLSK